MILMKMFTNDVPIQSVFHLAGNYHKMDCIEYVAVGKHPTDIVVISTGLFGEYFSFIDYEHHLTKESSSSSGASQQVQVQQVEVQQVVPKQQPQQEK